MCHNHPVVLELLHGVRQTLLMGTHFSTFHCNCTGNVHDVYVPQPKFMIQHIQEVVQNTGNIKRGSIALIPYEIVRYFPSLQSQVSSSNKPAEMECINEK